MKELQSALVIAARAPGRRAKQAGHRTCARNIIDISKMYATDLCILCKDDEDLSDIDYFKKICRNVYIRKISRLEGFLNILSNLSLPYVVAGRVSHSIKHEIKKFASDSYELIHLEWTETAVFANLSARRRQIFCYDILTELFERRQVGHIAKRIFWRWQTSAARNFERSYLLGFDRIFLHSQTDIEDMVRHGVPRNCLKVVAPEFYATKAIREKERKVPIRLLFWGSFSRSENREAARFFVDQILVRLDKRLFHGIIAGAESDKFFQTNDKILVTGFVEDVDQVFGGADIGVFPLFSGSGLKVKVLECLHAGVPVVTTHVGIEGFNCCEQDGVYLAETVEEFIFKINQLTNCETYRIAAQGARNWAQTYVETSAFSVI